MIVMISDVSIFSWSNKTSSITYAFIIDDVHCCCNQYLCLSSHSAIFNLWWSILYISSSRMY